MRTDWALTPEQRHDARAALRILDGTGITLESAAQRAVAGHRAVKRVKISEGVNDFVRSRLQESARAATVQWYESKLAMFDAQFGKQPFDDVTRKALSDWLNGLPFSDGTKAGIARAIRALWRWALRNDPPLAGQDATLGLRTTTAPNNGEAEFFTVEEVRAIMAGAGAYQNALAMLLFSGIRPEELAGQNKSRLLWRHVNIAEKLIRIPAEISKTGRPRVIDGLPDTLWTWLRPCNDSDPISPGMSRQSTKRAFAAIKRKHWPHDGTRHTFATYALAFTQDAGRVAHWLGHEGNPTMLHRHYRGLATKAEAERFFALKPI